MFIFVWWEIKRLVHHCFTNAFCSVCCSRVMVLSNYQGIQTSS